METYFADVEKFHEKFGLEYNDYPRPLSIPEKNFRLVCLREEVQEYADADNLEGEMDALVDLVYFALGTAYRHGFDRFDEAWKRVHTANMAKVVATNAKQSKRKYKGDIVKPKGWKSPVLDDLVYPKPNPALISISGGVYAKKRKNLTDKQIDQMLSTGKSLPSAED
jgi:predicted HAD superfamily Cof-like phosphohydrolase